MDYNKLKKDDLIEEIKKKDNEFNEMKSALAQLQQIVMGNMSNSNNNTNINDVVEIRSFMMGKEAIISEKDVEHIFDGHGSICKIRLFDCEKAIRRQTVKKLFLDGLLAFTDNKWYDHFGINKPFILSDDNICELLSKTDEEIYNKLSNITDSRTNSNVEHHFLMRVAWLLKNDPDKIKSSCVAPLYNFFPRTNDGDTDLSYIQKALILKK